MATTWDLLMDYFTFVMAGISGGMALAIFLSEEVPRQFKPILTLFYLIFGFGAFYLFSKAKEIANKKGRKTSSSKKSPRGSP